jgi:MFS family permease
VSGEIAPGEITRSQRIQKVLLVTPFAIVASSVFIALTALSSGAADQAVQAMRTTLLMGLILGIIAGGWYIVFGFTDDISWSWKTIVATANIGALVYAVVYSLAQPQTLAFFSIVELQDNLSFLQNKEVRFMLASIDGLVAGSGVGVLICFLDEGATHLSREGVTRYFMAFAIGVGITSCFVLLAQLFEGCA